MLLGSMSCGQPSPSRPAYSSWSHPRQLASYANCCAFGDTGVHCIDIHTRGWGELDPMGIADSRMALDVYTKGDTFLYRCFGRSAAIIGGDP
eukprot:scaffold496999_cov37-Prasinocladus_malaysianus.AAC.1